MFSPPSTSRDQFSDCSNDNAFTSGGEVYGHNGCFGLFGLFCSTQKNGAGKGISSAVFFVKFDKKIACGTPLSAWGYFLLSLL
jgi:hypothetical protein